MEKISNHIEARFVASKKGIEDIRPQKHATIECVDEAELQKIREVIKAIPDKEDFFKKNDSPTPKVEPTILKGEKKKLTTKDSELWNMNFEKKALKKQIRDELEDLQEKQFKLNKEKVNPYWEYHFNKDKQDLIGFGDLHYGAPSCDVEKIKDKVKAIKKHGTAVIGMGDWLENANRYSVGAGVYEQTMTPMQQMDEICKLVEPIKSQIMVLIDGNHEFRTWKECGFKPMQIIAERLGIPYAGFEAFVRMKVKKFTYTVYATHGSTSSRFPWTRMKALEDIMRNVDADITFMGHTHDKLAHEMAYKGITDKKKYGVLTGSFLKDDPFGYAAMKNLPPVKTGIIVLTLSGDHWDVHEKN